MRKCFCGSTETRQTEEVFANGTKHIREACDNCGRFIKWTRHPMSGKTLKERTYVLLKQVAASNIIDPEMHRLQQEAKSLLEAMSGKR